MSDTVLTMHQDRTAILTLNRPDKRNALSRGLIQELTAAFQKAEADANVRSIILTGSGSAFCAGMDLEELRTSITASADDIWHDAQQLSKLFDLIYRCPKPTIAAINGAAVAGGAGLASVCDLAVCVPEAKFGYPEVRRGLVAAMVLPHLLRHVGERTARWLLLTGELITAEEAFRIGLVNSVVRSEDLMTTAVSWCRSLAEGGPLALAKTKELLARCSVQSLGIDELAQASAEPRLTGECQDGLRAFFNKAKTPWS